MKKLFRNFSIRHPKNKQMATNNEESSTDSLLVAAFDFGTTYSGYAFSFRDDPLKIQTNQGWIAGSDKLISLKTPTCVLLTPNKQFHAFGFEAENRYADLAEDDNHHGWMLFRRFKMFLHNNRGLSRTTMVKDINGTSMPAMQIFSMAIRYLRDHLLKALNTQTTGVNETDIQYVITVPAIWNDNAKQFMREAAVKAGMDPFRLKLALEPEAASIWCQTVDTDKRSLLSKMDCLYMVVDLGGGTADISVHEKKANGSLKEIHKASGGPWGGTAVDNSYFDWLTNLFGERAMQRFKREQMADYFEIQREFEIKKRTVKSDTEGNVTFRLSVSLKDIYNEVEGSDLKRKVAEMGLADKVTFTGDKMRLDASIVRQWFKEPIKEIVTHIKNLLSEDKMGAVQMILLVGGFGECQLVQEEIRNLLQHKRLVVPDEAGLAVLKGAVRFGHRPQIVSSRVMKYTYGVKIIEWNEEQSQYGSDTTVHCNEDACSDDKENQDLKVKSRFQSDTEPHLGEPFDSCIPDVFDRFVAIGDEVPIGHEVRRVYYPTNPRRTVIPVYCTQDRNPTLVTDPGCEYLGDLSIQFPDGRTCKDNKHEVTLLFGDTELTVKAKIIRTGHEFFTRIDCLK